jgi:glycosyltransferase involved in cell wall biosynthesis
MGVPVCAGFYCQPENITYNAKMRRADFLNTFLYWLFNKWFYNKVSHIHCLSEFGARELARHGCKARFYPIPIPIQEMFAPASQETGRNDDEIRVMMTGRLTGDKRQDLIIRAVGASKYADKIHITFVGRGPKLKFYQHLSRSLPNPVHFVTDFIPREDLIKLLCTSDFYLHSSEVELESLACLEAVTCGRVPIISDSDRSAASQFALDGRSLFKKGDWRDLRDKLDWWIEHPDEKRRMEGEYIKLGRKYSIEQSVIQFEYMFHDTIRDFSADNKKMQEKA